MSVFDLIDVPALLDSTNQCIQCEACLEVCCTSDTADGPAMNPMERLTVIGRSLKGYAPLPDEVKALYYCTECGRCDTVCPQEIPISQTIADGKVMMVKKGFGPLAKHEKMIAGLLKNRNAVGKPAEERLAWVPEHLKEKIRFEDSEGDTLLYVGCLSSYMDKATAAASLEILMAAGENVKLLRDEYCCGIYPYNAGKWDEAKAIFTEMAETFKKSGIKRIIVPCAGCHRAFSSYYPRLLEGFDIKVLHMAEVIKELLDAGRLTLNAANQTVTVHDACKMGRKYGLYDIPREILAACGATLTELPENRDQALCCGSGAGVRSLDAPLSMKIAGKVLNTAEADTLVSTCPFCIFNMNYTSRKTEAGKKAVHIATLVKSVMARD
ncbi:(Fe-S)-binding protein [Desulfoluna spongiiphila]|uniref:Fe-S oxidoreductase n=1 Tax=Desulfoluna spongiiphila TaxID=419481 RepID=A0A1G5BII4_9BACT|nr:(Fe-S)-binding protein [Desulfoluna spongiiphila]SCX89965.1 Fe-S oxidoreductase [Desulfoluna spongiiphila]VVS93758.1 alpha-helical ferredoxin [Desulfoluna spongiiphila]